MVCSMKFMTLISSMFSSRLPWDREVWNSFFEFVRVLDVFISSAPSWWLFFICFNSLISSVSCLISCSYLQLDDKSVFELFFDQIIPCFVFDLLDWVILIFHLCFCWVCFLNGLLNLLFQMYLYWTLVLVYSLVLLV